MHKLILVRHGESLWNHENRFTGWQDIDLSDKGRAEAQQVGRTLKEAGFAFDIAFTSVLKRAIRTLWICLDEMDQMWIPIKNDWRFNEKHYGGLTGLNKAETAARHGEEQVKIWRRSYDTPPPMLAKDDPRHPIHDPRYKSVSAQLLPAGESLKDTVERVLPLWIEEIAPLITMGSQVLIVAHGNSLRALIQYLEKMSPEQIMEVNVPTGIPLQYELGADLQVLSKKYLGDPAVVQAAIEKVANQGKKK